MDVDPPPSSSSSLKRSSSAPMINVLGNTPSSRDHNYPPSPLLLSIPRTRRFSASFSPGQPSSSPQSPSSVLPSRVCQIKHEEGMDVMFRETAHEKEVQSKIQMSQSWEDLALDDNILGDASKRPRSLTDPLHIFTSPLGPCNSPSPTRTGKCFSPSTCLPVRLGSFNTSPIPSPTRKAFATRRSQSPIALRPSHFSAKRKYDIEMENVFSSPAKRLNSGPLFVHSPTHSSLSSSASLDTVNSPEQRVPQESLLQDMTDSMSTSSSDSPCSTTFKPLEPAPCTSSPQTQDTTCHMDDSSV